MLRLLTRPCGSDPTENDGVLGLRPNARGPGLVTFGPDRVKEFCEANNLQMIIRAHECVMDGAALMRAQTAVWERPTYLAVMRRVRALRAGHAHHALLRDQLLRHRQQRGRHPGARSRPGRLPEVDTPAPTAGGAGRQPRAGRPRCVMRARTHCCFGAWFALRSNRSLLGADASGSSPGERPAAADTWMQSINRDRPPTPPRGRVGPGGPPRGLSEF
jgi:hypothetical protein